MARESRMRVGLTLEDAAKRIGLTPEMYDRLEHGVLLPSVPTLRRMCLVLRLPAKQLLGPASARRLR